MVMAGNESTPGSLADDSLSTRLQWLRQHREALQEKLAQKNNELKNLCVEEAELTGVLPPEIPLEPGESPPVFRRKVGTAFTYPQNLINKLKTNEVEESALELERQVQIGIVDAALGIVNDPTESKAVRRKHRLVYQQSQRRLQELEARLNFIRQSRSKNHSTQLQHTSAYITQPHLHANVKHRTKKPRPPLDGTVNDANSKATRGLLQEGGISLSPLGSEDKCNTYPSHGYDEQSPVPNTCNYNHVGAYCPTISEQRQNIKIIEHDHNDNQNVYILPEQYRTRTYSHGSGSSRSQNHYQDNERMYRPLPNTYTEEERQMRYRQIQQQHLQEQAHNYQPYSEYKHLDNEIQRRTGQEYYERDFRTLHHAHISQHPVYHKNSSQQQLFRRVSNGSKNLRCTDSPGESQQMPSGYWMRYEDEIVWCNDDQPVADRFGSLDRRKRYGVQHTASIGADVQPRYRTVSVECSKNTSCITPHQNTSVHLLPLSEQPLTNNKMLLRTQSLGSVEKWHSNHVHELHESKDTTDNVSRKAREKEWYETSLDSGASPGLELGLSSPKNLQYQPIHPTCLRSSNSSNGDDKINYIPPMNHRKTDVIPPENEQHLQPLPARYEQTRKKVLEIPAESKPSQEANEETIILGSSQNCTIVQAGKYQPYREVTKPFEMSDFYKYSTKFRKRNEANGQNAQTDTQDDSRGLYYNGSNELHAESDCPNGANNGSVANSVQKRIYQPVQRMTCQPYLTTLR